ncbi:DUF3219 family protein [Ornithinibacillus scapharcae]|uniref:DUF3219 family protein n=1 Tax=Ornithinibacillus scapharcae TaxID=1147159 RepID=UPI0002F0AD7F|nr:DUF3219 family protein [Ornithinibacillus scapharcae]
MDSIVWINDLALKVEKIDYKVVEKHGRGLQQLELVFKVNHEIYHDVTTELYKNNFQVKVPHMELEIEAEIENYYTSITNLYEKNSIGEFTLVLLEK